jgi:hypothetical protein
MEDGATASGSVTTVQRVGDTIRRPTGHWTPAVHELLHFLEAAGFAGAPRVLGIDEQKREVLSFMPGETALRPWPFALLTNEGIAAVARFLRRYHAAVAAFTPSANAQWYVPDARWEAGQIIRHGDFGPWNMIWQGDELVGVIDWDFAEPGFPLEDVAQMAWYLAPLRGDAHFAEAGFEHVPDVKERLRVMCAAYGASPRSVLQALQELQKKEAQRLLDLCRGIEPWASFAARGDAEQLAAETLWLERNMARLN